MITHRLHVKENRPVAFSEATLKKVRELIQQYPEGKQKSALLPVLHMAQEELGGYLSVDVMDYVASLLQLNPIEVFEVATFYSMFYLEPVGKYVIEVCRTAPCAICGGEEILEYLKEKLQIGVGETTPDGLFTLKTVECLGGCGYAPVLQVNTQFHEQLDQVAIDRLLDTLRKQAADPSSADLTWASQFC
ncbi:MAG: NAD(P)H-dependent oxidoreductase subunit E [Bacteroidetes bacterium]|nr:MAG: NAD(P)H-dependent oxidoreductase subunit E [Bacteroidota bacterium]